MSCSEYEEKLVGYVEGLLDASEAEQVASHLQTCADCRDALAAIEGLQGRLTADGAAYAECDLEDAVVDRIVREQTFRLRNAERPSVWIGPWRIIMNTRFAKLAVAAVIVAGVVLGVMMFSQTSHVSWAAVAERVAMVKGVSYRMMMTMRNVPGMPEGMDIETEKVVLISDDCGMKMESYTGGKLISTAYVQLGKQEIVSLMPEQKKYMVVKLTDALLKETRRKQGDPKEFVSQFLSREYTELGRAKINGVAVEGVESDDPLLMGATSGEALARLWVDVDTGWPVQLTMAIKEDNGAQVEITIEDFVWDLAVDPAEFTAVIPEDYESMGSLNIAGVESGEQVVAGLRLFAEMGGRYPSDLSAMKIASEISEVMTAQAQQSAAAGVQPQEPDMQKVLDITMMGTFSSVMVQQDRDFAYYGAAVTPADTDKVLLRWKLDDGQYRVIFGDLRIEDVSAERLVELEAR